MVIKSTDMGIYNPTSIIESLDVLRESESDYSAYMVPVRHNTRLNQDLIMLESFVDYAVSNNIEDAGYAINQVCEVNNLSESLIGFAVNEATLYEDDAMLETVSMLKENGYNVAVAPISSTSSYYKELNEALILDEACSGYENSPNLMAYCGDYSIYSEGVINNAKERVNSTAKILSQKYAALKKKMGEVGSKIKSATGSAKAALQNTYDKLKDAASSVWSKLSSLKDKAVDTASNAYNTVKGAAGRAVDSIKNTAGSLKDKVSSKFTFD